MRRPKIRLSKLWLILIPLGFASNSGSAALVPCKGALESNNLAVLQWREFTPDGFLARAHIRGLFFGEIPAEPGFRSLLIKIGSGEDDIIELRYNEKYGTLPKLKKGIEVEACGDYVTSNDANRPYPPSPAGAIIHWVHVNPDSARNDHADGFLVIDGVLYGQER